MPPASCSVAVALKTVSSPLTFPLTTPTSSPLSTKSSAPATSAKCCRSSSSCLCFSLNIKFLLSSVYQLVLLYEITGAPGSPESGCSEQFGLRSKCASERPGLRLRWGHFVPAEPGFSAANATGGGSSGDIMHPGASRPHHAHSANRRRRTRRQVVSPPEQPFSSVPQFCFV